MLGGSLPGGLKGGRGERRQCWGLGGEKGRVWGGGSRMVSDPGQKGKGRGLRLCPLGVSSGSNCAENPRGRRGGRPGRQERGVEMGERERGGLPTAGPWPINQVTEQTVPSPPRLGNLMFLCTRSGREGEQGGREGKEGVQKEQKLFDLNPEPTPEREGA